MTEQLELGKWRTGRDAWVWLSENYDVSDLKESVIYKYLGKCEGRREEPLKPFSSLESSLIESKSQ